MTIDETIRAALRARIDQGESLRSIAAKTGHDHSQLSRFMLGKRGLATGEKFDALLRVLRLKINPQAHVQRMRKSRG
jgi:hypothetical protein